MNYAASMHPTATLSRPERRGAALGWGISLLAHALALAWLWQAWPQRAADTDEHAGKRIEIRLMPLVPKAPDAPRSAPASGSRPVHSAPAAAPGAHAATPPRHLSPATVDTPAPAVPAATVPETPPAPASTAGSSADAPSVDLAGARAAARAIAREDAKGLVALPARKPVVDPNGDHHVVDPIERARRVDCQTARSQSTNLLANVVLLAVDLAKNAVDDSGCKWH